ncbi:MAG: response regulator [Chthoniobacterales bacterium]|nr:response regulator [Chthoniobacterales bacterium]MDQ3118799.1 response regulator [Verrucomicrobiota bacterium]
MTFLKKILLVDYEPRVTAVVRKALEDTGNYLIKEERDSRHTLNAARWFQPDVILLNVPMSHPDGALVAKQLRTDRAFQDTPLVFLTLDTSVEGGIASDGIVAGYSFSATTVPLDELVRYVAELLNSAPY